MGRGQVVQAAGCILAAMSSQTFALAANSALTASSALTGRRAAPRVRLFVPADIILLRGTEACVLEDLSQHGARVKLATPSPRPGAGVVLQVHSLDVFGTVVWEHGQRFGLVFDEIVPIPQVVTIRQFGDDYTENQASYEARQRGGSRPRLRPFR